MATTTIELAEVRVSVGVDTHADVHVAAAIDQHGRGARHDQRADQLTGSRRRARHCGPFQRLEESRRLMVLERDRLRRRRMTDDENREMRRQLAELLAPRPWWANAMAEESARNGNSGINLEWVCDRWEFARACNQLRGERSYAELQQAVSWLSWRPGAAKLHSLLRGTSIPSRRTVLAFLWACGLRNPEDWLPWLTAWERLHDRTWHRSGRLPSHDEIDFWKWRRPRTGWRCYYCNAPLPEKIRSDAMYCSAACRSGAWRAARRARIQYQRGWDHLLGLGMENAFRRENEKHKHKRPIPDDAQTALRCGGCGIDLWPDDGKRSDRDYCSGACRTRAWRARRRQKRDG